MKHQTIIAQTRRSFFVRLLAGAALLLAMAPSWAADFQNIPGITEPFLDVTLNASVPGIISKRRFQEGDFVKAGDAIIELDQRLEELEVERRQLVVGDFGVDRHAGLASTETGEWDDGKA